MGCSAVLLDVEGGATHNGVPVLILEGGLKRIAIGITWRKFCP